MYNTKDITEPKAGLVCYTDSYWICVNGDPQQALFFNDAPQANHDRKCAEWVLEQTKARIAKKHSNPAIVFVPVGFVPKRA